MRGMSKKRAVEVRKYTQLRKQFLNHPDRKWCPVIGTLEKRLLRSTEIHHKAGRVGKLLNDTHFWLAVSREGHVWIHNHANLAREHGWLI